jgi:hypothetical protein
MKETTESELRELRGIRRSKEVKFDQRRRWKLADQTTGGSFKSNLPTVLTEVRLENI